MIGPKIKLVIFDLDETLIDQDNKLYNDTLDALHFLKNKNIKIALASYNGCARQTLNRVGISDFFYIIQYVNWQTLKYLDHKYYMLNDIIKLSGIDPESILFIDDNNSNLKTAETLNINTHHVNAYHRILLPTYRYDFD